MKHCQNSPIRHLVQSQSSTLNKKQVPLPFSSKSKPQNPLRNFKSIKKYPMHTHKRINLLDNDSSSDDEEPSLKPKPKSKLASYRPNLKPSIDRRKFVTLTKIDLSDEGTTPRLERKFSEGKRWGSSRLGKLSARTKDSSENGGKDVKKRMKSITESGVKGRKLDSNLKAATKISYTLKTKKNEETFLKIQNFPKYLGYYFRKAYRQVWFFSKHLGLWNYQIECECKSQWSHWWSAYSV